MKMKALTIIQPWASLIAEGIKDIENRSWKTNFRGEFLIHASARRFPRGCPVLSVLTLEQFYAARWLIKRYDRMGGFNQLPVSAIIGKVRLIDCVRNHPSVWAEEGAWHWVLADFQLFSTPIFNVKGRLGLWDFDDSLLL